MINTHIFGAIYIAAAWGAYTVFYNKYMHNVDSKTLIFLSMVFYTLFTFIYILYHNNVVRNDLRKISANQIMLLAGAAFVLTFLPNIVFYHLVNKCNSIVLSGIIYSAPVFTVLLSMLLLRSEVTMPLISGVMLVVFGLIIIVMNSK